MDLCRIGDGFGAEESKSRAIAAASILGTSVLLDSRLRLSQPSASVRLLWHVAPFDTTMRVRFALNRPPRLQLIGWMAGPFGERVVASFGDHLTIVGADRETLP